ncbi:putative PEP-binding protein [Rhodococcus sp. IEGM 1379]|uniref:phosphoenolpyruvate--protein phosphotransferase n=1 Tax=Rhodococcus sp. IEGM 1379 TaxID=3047086 RepID=UPI0024B7BB3E|nr:putative PEP-binding protein [Rhodococcus sp. IEGM 1379]MDI9918012.1 PEP-utilizing enzyme [Rhodococcus sp. IEGM 1379]
MTEQIDHASVHGTPVVPGVAYGPAIWPARRPELVFEAPPLDESVRASAQDDFIAAAKTVEGRLLARAADATGAAAEVLVANAAMAADRGWIGAAQKSIAQGVPPVQAAIAATEQFVTVFTKLGGLMAERVTDLKDIRDRVIAELAGLPEPGIPAPETPSILCADDLAPADTAGLDPAKIIGLVTVLGGPTSHTAIIARQLGIPCIVAVKDLATVVTGTPVLIDGTTGQVISTPDADQARALVEESRLDRERVSTWVGPGQTADGVAVNIMANVQDGAGARAAALTQAEGIGLFRTELCFLGRETEPTVDEQAAIYAEVLEAFAGKKIVIRTLDAGSDKPLKFANHQEEANPALGVRGVRIAWQDMGILDRQLDAIAVAAARTGSRPWVMAPMIATPAEAKRFADAVRARNLVPGVMVEIPAAALLADQILEHVEFLSIGTNDLAQYTMAADRMSSELAELTDPWQPAVIALVARTAQAGKVADKRVGVCGEAAADPLLACVLAGLGVSSLSAASASVAGVGAKIGSVTMAQCEAAATAVLATGDPAEARKAAARVLT